MKKLLCSSKQHPLVRWLAEGQKTVAYPIFFAVACVISGMFGKEIYVPIFWLLCATVVFAALFCDDLKVFLTPMLLIYYGLGQDRKPIYNETTGNVYDTFDPDGLWHICISGGVMIAAFLLRLLLDGTLRSALTRRRPLTIGILAMDAAFLLGGLFSATYHPMNLLYGAFLAMGLTLFYTLTAAILERSREVAPYACFVLVCLSWTAVAQFAVQFFRAWRVGLLFIRNEAGQWLFRRDMFQLPWGISTLIGAVMVLGIPAALYLARNKRFPWLSVLSACVFVGAALFHSRSAMAVGAFLLMGGLVLCCTGGRNKKQNRVTAIVLLLLVLAALPVVHTVVYPLDQLWIKAREVLRLNSLMDNSRMELWKNGLADFLARPIFGVGLWDGAYEQVRQMDHLYSSMYHNIFVQWGAAFGIVGLGAFLFHLWEMGKQAWRHRSANHALLLAVPAALLALSLLDNFFFYLNFQILYTVFLVVSDTEQMVSASSVDEKSLNG
ncbi:MAG: O-antigen ligase family protein [Clostridia bacterium]|nr:O-antigen ligase family protein [Clostridia bacterium]